MRAFTGRTWLDRDIFPLAALITCVGLGLAGCGTVQFEVGKTFSPEVLETSLKIGTSTQDDVLRVLGEPYGKGRALMPYQESDRSVWTYYHERGNVDIASGNTKDQRLYLFLFLAGNRFDGYMWFASTMD